MLHFLLGSLGLNLQILICDLNMDFKLVQRALNVTQSSCAGWCLAWRVFCCTQKKSNSSLQKKSPQCPNLKAGESPEPCSSTDFVCNHTSHLGFISWKRMVDCTVTPNLSLQRWVHKKFKRNMLWYFLLVFVLTNKLTKKNNNHWAGVRKHYSNTHKQIE